MNFQLIISLIGSLKRRESLNREVELKEMKRVRDLGAFGPMKTVRDLPWRELWAICTVTRSASVASQRLKFGRLSRMTYSLSLVRTVCGTLSRVQKLLDLFLSKKFNNNNYSIRNPEDPSQMARMLANEARERWDLFNEINRTKKKLSLEGLDEVRKKSSL
jgi:hypothetical protein